MPIISIEQPQNFLHVNFTNRGLVKVFKSVRSLDPRTPNRDSVIEVAKILKDIKIDQKDPVGFTSIPEFVGIDYTGYVVDKERLDKATGQWLRIDEYRILGSKASNFKDSRLAYGNCYRYRIKTMIKVTHRKEIETLDKFDIQEDIREIAATQVDQKLEAQQQMLARIDQVTNLGLTPRSSTGPSLNFGKSSRRSSVPSMGQLSFNVFDNLSIVANADKTDVVATSANNALKNIENLRQLQNLAVSDLSLTTGVISESLLQKIVKKGLEAFKETKFEYVSYYYTGLPSDWQYVQVSENIPPPPPSAIKIIPNSQAGLILITWLTPANSQRDIIGFKLYRRQHIGTAWEKLGEFDLIENLFEDKSVKFNRQYIYALTCVDAHGFESFLSMQIEAELNSNFIVEGEERPLRWISGSGARPDKGFTEIFKKFFEPEVPIVAEDNVVIGPTRLFNETQKKFVVRIKSLDIHESKEFVISLENENVGTSTG